MLSLVWPYNLKKKKDGHARTSKRARYIKARYWAKRRALCYPEVLFVADLDGRRISYVLEDGRLIFRGFNNQPIFVSR